MCSVKIPQNLAKLLLRNGPSPVVSPSPVRVVRTAWRLEASIAARRADSYGEGVWLQSRAGVGPSSEVVVWCRFGALDERRRETGAGEDDGGSISTPIGDGASGGIAEEVGVCLVVIIEVGVRVTDGGVLRKG